jgi:precorrin-8X/cobalt-precorrin-8 methylmutase
MEFIKNPKAIEDKSMSLIDPFIRDMELTEGEVTVYSRMIHASGDVDYGHLIATSTGAVKAGIEALDRGCNIYCDVEMVRTGINKNALGKLGGQVFCRVSDPAIVKSAAEKGIARSLEAMNSFGTDLNGAVIAIGNAPTALFEAVRMALEDGIRPALIVGIPVGFVGAAESKEYLIHHSPVPYITVRGNKGGSSIAASVVNAMMYNLVKRSGMLYVEGRK